MTADVTEVLDPALRRTLSAFEVAGVRWVVLRGRGQLAAPGHDVDLLVAAPDLPHAEDIIFALAGVALPRRVHPWHRMYLLDRVGSPPLLLDVVTEVVFHRRLRLASGLEEGILARRTWDGTAQVMDASDLFWTVLLHCLLDKQDFRPRRRAELLDALPDLVAGSPWERYCSQLTAGAPAAEELVHLVRCQDWPALVAAGEDLVRRLDPCADPAGSVRPATPAGAENSAMGVVRARLRRLAAAAYPHVWRRVGLGATPRAPFAVRDAGVDVRIEDIRRRPLLCTSVLRTDGQDVGLVGEVLRSDGFVKVGGARYRPVTTGLERTLIRARLSDTADRGGSAMTMVRTSETIPNPAAGGRRPVVVSFSGLDGAGKTRQIDALVEALGADHPVELRWVPFKIWPEGLLNRLPAGLRSRMGPGRTDAVARASRASGATTRSRTGAARRAVWWGIGTLASVSAGVSLRRRASRSAADVLVLDRYRLDAAVKLQFWYPDVPARWLARLVTALAPAPDLEVLLRVAPAVAHARKPEQWSVAQLTRQARLYDGLAQGRRVVVLDAEDDPEQISEAVLAQVQRVLDER